MLEITTQNTAQYHPTKEPSCLALGLLTLSVDNPRFMKHGSPPPSDKRSRGRRHHGRPLPPQDDYVVKFVRGWMDETLKSTCIIKTTRDGDKIMIGRQSRDFPTPPLIFGYSLEICKCHAI